MGSQGNVSVASILRMSYKLTKTVPLQDLSIVIVAKALGVTPALIHYYIGGRDWLTSGTMNLFYTDLLKRLPAFTGDWKRDLRAIAHTIYERLTIYGGVASYMVSHSRFRTFQLTSFGQRDTGVEVLEKVATCVLQAGCSPERTGIYAYLVMEWLISSAHSTVRHLFPVDHREFLEEKLAKLDPLKFPTLILTNRAPFSLGGETAFNEGMRLFMLGLQNEARSNRSVTPIKRRQRRSSAARAARNAAAV